MIIMIKLLSQTHEERNAVNLALRSTVNVIFVMKRH